MTRFIVDKTVSGHFFVKDRIFLNSNNGNCTPIVLVNRANAESIAKILNKEWDDYQKNPN